MLARAGLVALAAALASGAAAQDAGTLELKPLPPLAHPEDPKLPAKEVFGRELTPIELKARSIGFYARGCLAGAKALPVDGETWRVMRLSRNRRISQPIPLHHYRWVGISATAPAPQSNANQPISPPIPGPPARQEMEGSPG